MHPGNQKRSKSKDTTRDKEEKFNLVANDEIDIVDIAISPRNFKADTKQYFKVKVTNENSLPTIVLKPSKSSSFQQARKSQKTQGWIQQDIGGSWKRDTTLPSISVQPAISQSSSYPNSAKSVGTFLSGYSLSGNSLPRVPFSCDCREARKRCKFNRQCVQKLNEAHPRNREKLKVEMNKAEFLFVKELVSGPGTFKGGKLANTRILNPIRPHNFQQCSTLLADTSKFVADMKDDCFVKVKNLPTKDTSHLLASDYINFKRNVKKRPCLSGEWKNGMNANFCIEDQSLPLIKPAVKNAERPLSLNTSADKNGRGQYRLMPSAGRRFKKQNAKAERIISMKSLVVASESVGVICYDKTFWGTGFVVGGCFVLTAFHVVRDMLGLEDYVDLLGKIECGLSKTSCCVIFNVQQDLVPKYQYFPFKPKVSFFNIQLDAILLEMVENFEAGFPQSILSFGDLQTIDSIHFIGHPDGKPKQVDMQCSLSPVNMNDVESLRESLRDAVGNEDYNSYAANYDPYFGLGDEKRYFFNCTFEHTASGSPGIVVDNNGNVKVCTMLLGGYPMFYWDLSDETKAKIHPNSRFEFGVKMSELYTSMKEENEELCGKVFKICLWN